MTRFVLVSDTTLSYEYRHFPLLDFLPCAPAKTIPGPIYRFLKGPEPPNVNGIVKYAPYAVRKIEASLVKAFGRDSVVVINEDYLGDYVDEKTEVIGVSTMDPLGLGPTTMSYYALFGGELDSWVRREWDTLLEKVNKAREGKKAKLIVGGPGVWEFAVLRDEIEKYHVDYYVQGESDDVVAELFRQVADDDIDGQMFYKGYMTYDDQFHKILKKDENFLARGITESAYPRLEDIPEIVAPSMKGMVEVMRGCGVGCDFCEVTLRPLRYMPINMIVDEIKINVAGGVDNAWLHSDEVFGYKHGHMFEPNEDALSELFTAVMSVPGVRTSNPTHGRISIPAGYPDMIAHFSKILKAGPKNWIGIQTGLETGSEELARKHMPNKTLPLKIGPDGSWQDIVWEGVAVETQNYWRSAFTIQVGQEGETPEDLWDTISLINKLSYSYTAGRPFEFTVTPLVNVPLGRIKYHKLNTGLLDVNGLAVYYASYRHLAKMAARDGLRDAHGNIFMRAATGGLISFGGKIMMDFIEKKAQKAGVDIEKVKRYGIENEKEITSLAQLARA